MYKKSFPIHLCQPDHTKSCGACCGIYNFCENSKEHVLARLRRNTEAVRRGPLGPRDRIRSHSQNYRQEDNGAGKRFQTVFNCEFPGFLNTAESRVGCLLHPARHEGDDLRHLSFYGQTLCAGHFCLSYYYLTEAEQRLVVDVIDDWYLYGLVVTDIDFVKGIYETISNRLGEGLKPERASNPAFRISLARLYHLKIDWPFRPADPDRFGKYLFKGEHYEEIRIPYARWHRRPSVYNRILVALGSEPADSSDLDRAESLLDTHVSAVVSAYENAPTGF